ncbi:MAG: diguanylate cyclase [Thermodesulfovibrionales bacterium]
MVKQDIQVLVVDDDESLVGVLSQLLEGEEYKVTTASSAEEALEVFRRSPCPLVITDIKMHGMSGIELLQKLKELDADTQVIIMTSYATVDTSLAALRLGAYDYMIKPFEDIELVIAIVNRAVEKIGLTKENRTLLESLTRNKHELEQLNTTLQNLAVKDGLTGLYNHRFFQETIAKELARCQRYHCIFSLVFLDIDHFKKYNDANGHPAGDELLKKLAELMSARLRRTDMIVRYGGEEFVIMLPATAKPQALLCAENVRQMIAEYPFEGRQSQPLGFVSVSMGVASYPRDGADVAALVKSADDALYKAKGAGRNRVCEAGTPDGP